MNPHERAQNGSWRTTTWTIALLTAFFAIAVFLRAYFNFGPSYSDGLFRWTGTDPYYHLRVMEHILATGEFLLFDRLINYPVGAVNPRPPLFSWTTAAVGGLLSPFFGGDGERSLHMVAMFSPAVWAALTVIPVYLLAKTAFNRTAGLWAAFLVAIMPAHMMRAALGDVDHDAMIMFLITFGAWAFVKSLRTMKVQEYVPDYRDFSGVRAGYARFFTTNQAAVAYALLAGAFWAAVALTWKGYVYIFGILAIWFGLQMFFNHLRHRDNTPYFIVGLLPFILALVLMWPYYTAVGRVDGWVMPAVFILLGMIVASFVFVPTRHWPPVLVIPSTILVAALGVVVLIVFFPERWATLSTGMGYFEQTKLYSTIAEAQRTDMGFLAFSVGVVPFFFGLIGVVMAIVSFFRRGNDAHLFLFTWAGTGILMAFTATRFVFNSAVPFAVMSGWVLARFVEWIRFGDVGKAWHTFRSAGAGVFRTTRNAVGFRQIAGVLFLVFVLLMPSLWLGVDAGVPREYVSDRLEEDGSAEFWQQRFGAFGQSFLSRDWVESLAYLRVQDQDLPASDRPAFIAWWDYGFYAANEGRHPAVADPFQFGYQISGRFLASVSEAEAVTWLTIRLLEANSIRGERSAAFDDEVRQVLDERREGLADEVQPLVHRGRDYDQAYLLMAQALSDDANDTDGEGDGDSANGEFDELNTQQLPGENPQMPGMGPEDPPESDGPDTTEIPTPDLDEIVSLYREVRDATGDSIRYFALDGRMFPCDDPRSGQVDSGSIFYAPVFLADKNPEDFVRTVYMDGAGQQYYQRSYETVVDGDGTPVSRELDRPFVEDQRGQKFILSGGRLLPMAEGGYVDYTSDLAQNPIQLQRDMLEYDPAFYDTILYRAWVGQAPSNPQQNVPPPQEYAPGQDLRHFRLVFTTMRVPDTDDVNRCGGQVDGEITGYAQAGDYSPVSILKYYDGAPVEGVVRDDEGNALEDVTVRVVDNFGIAHDRMQTDADGGFDLLAPFSTEDDPSEMAAEERRFTLRDTGANAVQVVVGDTVVYAENFSVSDAQAMRLEPGPAPFDIQIELGSLSGTVFHDSAGDGAFNETAGDFTVSGAEVRLGERNTTTDENGMFSFTSVLPGDREVQVFHDDYQPARATVNVPPGAQGTVEVGLTPAPVEVSGVLSHEGDPVEGATVVFESQDDPETRETSDPSDAAGNYSLALPVGSWNATVEYETFDEEGGAVRYTTPEPVPITIAFGEGPQTLDLQLQSEEVDEPGAGTAPGSGAGPGPGG